jgi:hypothetical protein
MCLILQVRQRIFCVYASVYVLVCVYLGQSELVLTGMSADILRVCKCVCACMCVFRPELASSHAFTFHLSSIRTS